MGVCYTAVILVHYPSSPPFREAWHELARFEFDKDYDLANALHDLVRPIPGTAIDQEIVNDLDRYAYDVSGYLTEDDIDTAYNARNTCDIPRPHWRVSALLAAIKHLKNIGPIRVVWAST